MAWENRSGQTLEIPDRPDTFDVIKTFLQTETVWSITRNDPESLHIPSRITDEQLEVFITDQMDEEDQAYLLASPHRKELEKRFGEIRAAQEEELILSSASGDQLIAAMLFGIAFDPLNLIPAGIFKKFATAAKAAGNANKLKLFAAGTNARAYGLAGMGVAGFEEAVIHANVERRTLGDSILTIGGVGALGAALGKYVDVNTARKAGIQDKLKDNIEAIDNGIKLDPRKSFDENIAPSMGMDKLAAFTSPLVRLMSSPSPSVRAFAENIMEVPFYLSKNFDSIKTGASLEEDIKSSWREYGNYMQVLDNSYVKYIKGQASDGIGLPLERMAIDVKNKIFNEGKMTFAEFDALVTKYRAGAVTDVPDEVKKAAKAYDAFYKKWEPAAKKIWKGDGAGQNYITRRYNTALIAQNPLGFEDFLFDQYRRNVDDYDPTQEEMIRDIFANTIRKMIDSPNDRIDIDEIFDETTRGPLRMRYFNFIDEAELYRTDWVFHSSKDSASYYTKSAVADIYFQQRFGTLSQLTVLTDLKKSVINEFFSKDDIFELRGVVAARLSELGFDREVDLADILIGASKGDLTPEIEALYTDMIERIGKHETMGLLDEAIDTAINIDSVKKKLLTADEAKALTKELELSSAMLQRVRGTYMDPNSPLPGSVPARVIDGLMKFNNLRIGGGFLLSSFVDIGRPVMNMGFKRAYGPAFDAFIKGNKEVLAGMKASSNELRSWAVGNELYFSQRLQSMVDQLPQSNEITKIERALGKGNDAFFILNGLTIWNEFMKKNVGIGVVDRLATIAKQTKLGSVSQEDLAAAAYLGLDKNDLLIVAEQLERHGNSYKGVTLTNASSWSDQKIAKRFFDAVRKETDIIIVPPGVGDTPLIMSNSYVSMIAQYKTFALAATNRMLVRGVQQPDANMMNGLLVSIAAGMSIQMYKDLVNDRNSSPESILAAGIDRSGMLASIGMANSAIQASPFSGLAITGDAKGGLPFSRNLGPTYGTMSDVSKIVSGDPQSGAALERLNPLRSLFYIGDALKVMDRAIEEDSDKWYDKSGTIPTSD